jgi:hypothetical protein
MLTAIDITQVRHYILEEDRKSTTPTTFHIGQIDGILMAFIEDDATRFGFSQNQDPNEKADVFISNNERNLNLVRFGMKGWENFGDAKNNLVGFELQEYNVPGVGARKGVKQELLMRFRLEWLAELASQIRENNTVTEEELKN